MDYTEKWGKYIDEAVELALIDLKVSREDVEVTVLEEPTKGFLGIGAKLAKVKVEKKKPAEPEKPEKPAKPKESKAKEKKQEKKPNTKKAQEKKPEEKRRNIVLDDVDINDLKEVEEHEALTFLKDITEKARVGEDLVYVEMNGKDSRTVIGKRGQTLDAIQYLASLVVNKDREKYTKVVVDAENYRAKRERTLEQLANRLGAKVVKTRKHVRLEPMNPYERKVIHATLQKNPNITTRSEGEEPYRRVVIELKK